MKTSHTPLKRQTASMKNQMFIQFFYAATAVYVFYIFFSIRRGHSTSASSDKSQSAVAPVRATHVTSQSHDARDVSGAEEFLKTQDDSVVYSETPTKKQGSKLKSQRRVESFK